MFITEILPEYFNKDVINLDELKVIGPDINGMKNSCYLMKIIINWMYVNKFSNAKIIFDWQ